MEYRLIRSDRRTISLQIVDGELVVRAPKYMPQWRIQQFVQAKSAWVEKHLQKQQAESRQLAFTKEQIKELANRAAAVLPQRVEHFARQLGVTYERISIRSQHTRWGSCSTKGNLNFNCLLMLAPPEVLDYVVIHELCHRLEMNHSARFWTLVENCCPDYRSCRRWLKENGTGLIRRLPK